MAAELASGFVSLTVKLAKGGMAEVTKEVTKAGADAGKTYSDEFSKKVDTEVGKKLPDAVTKATKSGGGGGAIGKAGKQAAEEFGKGLATPPVEVPPDAPVVPAGELPLPNDRRHRRPSREVAPPSLVCGSQFRASG